MSDLSQMKHAQVKQDSAVKCHAGCACAVSMIDKVYDYWTRGLAWLQSPLLLLLRLYWGYQFFITGKGKLMNLDRTADFFGNDLHIPFPHFNAMMAGTTECVCGLLLLFGLGSRLITVPLIAVMFVAYGTAHREALSMIFSDSDKFVTAPAFLFMLACVIILCFGPGRFSLDHLIGKWRKRHGKVPVRIG